MRNRCNADVYQCDAKKQFHLPLIRYFFFFNRDNPKQSNLQRANIVDIPEWTNMCPVAAPGGGHGGNLPPSDQRLCPPHFLPNQKEKMAKNQPFSAIFFILPPPHVLCSLDAPWCRHCMCLNAILLSWLTILILPPPLFYPIGCM